MKEIELQLKIKRKMIQYFEIKGNERSEQLTERNRKVAKLADFTALDLTHVQATCCHEIV